MSRPRPGRLWLFFYGRRRRGFPGLLLGVLLLALLLGLTYATRTGTVVSWWIGAGLAGLLGLLALAALVGAAFAALRPPPKR